jgi:hypothetical protein
MSSTLNPGGSLAHAASELISQGLIQYEPSKYGSNDYFLIKLENLADDRLLAGAKIPVKDTESPFAFTLYEENLLIPKKEWQSFAENDHRFDIRVCGSVVKGDCVDESGRMSAESRKVVIGTSESTQRQVRLPPYMKL